MSDRDELAKIIYDVLDPQYGDFCTPIDAADAIIAAGWRPPARTVTTVEEAKALRDGTLIVDSVGDSGYVWGGSVNYPETAFVSTTYALKHYGPFTVVWEPEEGEEE